MKRKIRLVIIDEMFTCSFIITVEPRPDVNVRLTTLAHVNSDNIHKKVVSVREGWRGGQPFMLLPR